MESFLGEAAKAGAASEHARHRAELVSFGMGSIVMLSSCRMLLNVCRSLWWRRLELFTSGPLVQPAQLEGGGVNGSNMGLGTLWLNGSISPWDGGCTRRALRLEKCSEFLGRRLLFFW